MSDALTLLHLLIIMVSFVVVLDAVASWVAPDTRRWPRLMTQPIVGPLRRPLLWLMPPARFGGIDVSWVVLVSALGLLASALPTPT